MRREVILVLVMLMGCGSESETDGNTPDSGSADVQSEVGADVVSEATVDAGSDGPGSDAEPDGPGDAAPPTCIEAEGELPRSLEMPGAEVNGAFDPNLALDPASGRLWISYSGVTGPAGSGYVSTHLAYSDDDGVTWCELGTVNPSEDVAKEDQPPSIAQDHGHWNHETSAIVYDPDAPSDEQWRLMWHRYLYVEDNDPATEDRHFEHGWIAQRKAATAAGLMTASEQKLFSSLAYYVPGVQSYNDAAPGGSPKMNFSTDPDLGDCLAFAEPGVIAHDGALYVAMFCARTETLDTVLVRLDHGTDTWSYVSTLLTSADAAALNPALETFNGADLVRVGNEVRLITSPAAGAYFGCITYGIDLAAGTLGAPLHAYERNPDTGVYQTGACTFDEDAVMGLVVGDTYIEGVQFRLIATGEALP